MPEAKSPNLHNHLFAPAETSTKLTLFDVEAEILITLNVNPGFIVPFVTVTTLDWAVHPLA